MDNPQLFDHDLIKPCGNCGSGDLLVTVEQDHNVEVEGDTYHMEPRAGTDRITLVACKACDSVRYRE